MEARKLCPTDRELSHSITLNTQSGMAARMRVRMQRPTPAISLEDLPQIAQYGIVWPFLALRITMQ